MCGLRRIIMLAFIMTTLHLSNGCALRSTGIERSATFQQALDDADKAWRRRGKDGLQPVEEALKEALVAGPKRPAGLWRMSRLYASKGWAAKEQKDRREYFSQSRYFGERCLMTNAAFSGRQAQFGWEVALDALEGFDACTVWLFHGWAAYSVDVGRSAMVDMSTLRLLEAHTARSSFGPVPKAWAVALVSSLGASGQLPSEEAGDKYEEAIAKSKSLALRLDYINRWVLPAKGEAVASTLLLEITKKKAVTPEDVTAQRQAKLLLAAFQN